tara:strand:+ start:106 stop:369 length:264 start_codon:yes stop_codon:yes gene_type:complete
MNKSFKIPENITFESIDKNVYILNVENGEYFKLSESASFIWNYIENGLSSEEIIINLKSLFDENDAIDDDVEETLNNFVERGFIAEN